MSPTSYHMYYSSWDATRQRHVVGFATSPDALRWRKQGPIFEGGQSEEDHDAKVIGQTGCRECHVLHQLQRYVQAGN